MATTGTGTPLANEPNKHRTEAGANTGSGLPPEGQDTGATAGTIGTARAEGAREARKEAHLEQGKAQRIALLRRAEEAAAKLAELMGKLAETGASSLPDKTGREDRLKAAAAILQMAGLESQPAPGLGGAVRKVAVFVFEFVFGKIWFYVFHF
jgi:hypothetical protein